MEPVSIELENFLSYNRARLNFDFTSALIVGETNNNERVSNGSGKCLAGDTLLYNPITKERIKIKELFNTKPEDFHVYGLDKTVKLVPTKVVGVAKSGIKSIYEVSTRSGFTQKMSSSHPLLIGLLDTKPLANLRVGSLIAEPRFVLDKVDSAGAHYNQDISWTRVEKIKYIGQQETYDIEIDNETHLYALDGFITHNSSLFEAVRWALHGESRNKVADNVVKRGQLLCRVGFIFNHDGRTYRVNRIRNSKNSKMEVQFEELCADGTIRNLTRDTNKLTDAVIRDIIKSNDEVFINSSYFRQNSISGFTEGTFASRQNLIGSLLSLDKWNIYQKSAKDKYSELNTRLEKLKNEAGILANLPEKLEQIKTSVVKNKERLAELEDKEKKFDKIVREMEKTQAGQPNKSDISKFKNLKESYAEHKELIANSEKTVILKKDNLNSVLKNIELSEAGIIAADTDIIRISAEINKTELPDLTKLETSLMDGRSQLKALVQQIDTLSNNDVCLVCGNEWTDAENKAKTLSEKQNKFQTLRSQIERAEVKLKELKNIERKLRSDADEIDKIKLKKSKLESNIEFGHMKKSALLEEVSASEKYVASISARLKEIEAALAEMKHLEAELSSDHLEIKINKGKESVKNIRAEINSISYSQGALTQEANSIEIKIENLNKINSEIVVLARHASIFGGLAKSFGKDGIQAIIIDNVIEELTKVANYWLTQFCDEPIYIAFITQKKNTKGDWKETLDIEITTNTGTSQFEDFSGGEQFRISFAIRLALASLQAKRMGGQVQLLMLDEVSTSLDAAGLEIFVSLIRKLEKDMKIMVITHDDKLKDEFDTILTIKKSAAGSEIVR